MPTIDIYVYRDADGDCPLTDWLDEIAATRPAIYAKCVAFIKLLGELGNELHRPQADYLRDAIYELRPKSGHVNYRILYSFCGRGIAVLSHGCTKEDVVPDKEIELAIQHRNLVLSDFQRYTVEWDE